jgi:predicted dehydrogenase
MKVKIFGAGSIGNHLANASRTLGWTVHVCDVDEAALTRTRTQIYPNRYGRWDDTIQLFLAADAPKGGYDLIVVGTPPDTHVRLALQAIDERPGAVLVEKPFCTPDLAGAHELFTRANAAKVPVFVGYDHVVGKASDTFAQLVSDKTLLPIDTLDVEFREYWGGIFAAHPWLSGPGDSYLGFWRQGGGALGEHSHAANLWQHFAHQLSAGRVIEVQAMMDYVNDGRVDYDKLCLLNLRTDKGLVGRVVQDVVTSPPRKWARAQGKRGFVEWHCSHRPGVDAVFSGNGDSDSAKEYLFPKTRPDDFIQELRHIESAVGGNPATSHLSIERGLDTMLTIAAAHKSAREQRTVLIDYSAGYTLEALK